MNEKEYVSNLGFVAEALSCGIEKLPKYVVPSDPSSGSETPERPFTAPQTAKLSTTQNGGYDSQQGVKRTCGHSHKSVRVEHSEKK